jgi:hypothetical protein
MSLFEIMEDGTIGTWLYYVHIGVEIEVMLLVLNGFGGIS